MFYTTEKQDRRRLALRLIRKGASMAHAARVTKSSHQLVRYWVVAAGIKRKQSNGRK
jgi:hypothetical protein